LLAPWRTQASHAHAKPADQAGNGVLPALLGDDEHALHAGAVEARHVGVRLEGLAPRRTFGALQSHAFDGFVERRALRRRQPVA
jgi:hypothetical protein